MPRSSFAVAVDGIQNTIKPYLTEQGFRVRGRTFNRMTEDGLTQVVNFQMGPSDPPGTKYVPGLTSNLHGLFAVNLGIYVPEVAKAVQGEFSKNWSQEYDCCVRSRLGALIGNGKEIWWHTRNDPRVTDDILAALKMSGIPFLERFQSRELILSNYKVRDDMFAASSPPRYVAAIILAHEQRAKEARHELSEALRECRNEWQRAYVHELCALLGLAKLET